MKALRLKLREKTRRLRPGSMEAICGEMKPVLRGWFRRASAFPGNTGSANYDVSSQGLQEISVVLNWLEELKRLVPKE